MTVKQLIEKLNKFNPDGSATVLEHFDENDDEIVDDIYKISMEEDRDGNLVIIIHTTAQ